MRVLGRRGSLRACLVRRFGSCSGREELTDSVKREIEKKWKHLVSQGTYSDRPDETREKSYVLSMFPYPSGNLHMGHVRVYTISDTIARFHRLGGKNVFHPMGFDAFGLPAENAAFERKIPPKEWTENNMVNMRRQLEKLGLSFDWSHEVITCSPDYYKFTQYIFLLLYDAGLVYRRQSLVNWDPADGTVLAEEQVDASGRSWRSNAVVEKRLLEQWFVRTRRFAGALYEGLGDPRLRGWKDVVKLQKHWIGECDGACFEFRLEGRPVEVWTRYPELVGRAAFVAAAPGSALASSMKPGSQVVNPFTGTGIPLVISDSVDYDEGRDLRLGLPDAFEKDLRLAQTLNLEFEPIVFVPDPEERKRVCRRATEAKIGGYLCSSKLRDWLISRQRSWGTPIPVVHCEKCGPSPVLYEELPVTLPEPDKLEEWRRTRCPKCKGAATRETDTMDTFVDSSWYFMRYCDPRNSEEPFSKDKASKLMPVDVYVGGKEHATLHLYYARFVSHFLHSLGMLDEPEPFGRLLVQGMVMGRTYRVRETGKYLPEGSVDFSAGNPREKLSGLEVEESWDKMSKSKHNGVDPDSALAKYGIDTTRLLMLSDVAPTSNKYWSDDSSAGILKWQSRLWDLVGDFIDIRNGRLEERRKNRKDTGEEEIRDARNFYTKGTTFNYLESHQLSVAVSKLQGFTNGLNKCNAQTMSKSRQFERALGSLIVMLSPMAPHFSAELWAKFQRAPGRLDSEGLLFDWDEPVLAQRWPGLDGDYKMELICKVNNAVKANIWMPYDRFKLLAKSEAVAAALRQKKVNDFIEGCDLLDADFMVVENYQAVVNLIIDHTQRKQSIGTKV